MTFEITDRHINQFQTQGYTVFEEILPSSLIGDLRTVCAAGAAIVRRDQSVDAQRFQPVSKFDIDRQPFRDYAELPELSAAVQTLLSPDHTYGDPDFMGVLINPTKMPWCTNWHRDWRDHIPEAVFESEFRDEWEKHVQDYRYWYAQINCALYHDSSTWFVPGSVFRQKNTSYEEAHLEPYGRAGLTCGEDEHPLDAERRMLAYCRDMPGAVQLHLRPGDFCIYRPCAFHLGNYSPDVQRATLHDGALTPHIKTYIGERGVRAKKAGEALTPKPGK